MERKIHAMHEAHGKTEGRTCSMCCNFEAYRHHGKRYRKCAAYGLTHSEATDWAGRYEACGLYGTPFEELHRRPMIEVMKRGKKEPELDTLDGQVGMWEE